MSMRTWQNKNHVAVVDLAAADAATLVFAVASDCRAAASAAAAAAQHACCVCISIFFPYITLTLARTTFPMWRILNPEYTSTWRWALLNTDNAFLMHVLQFAVLLFCPKSCCCCHFCFWDRTIASSDCALPSSLFSLFSAADAAACCCC